ncbi:putative mediator of RNA polymerase II transcription subunit 26 [Symsagittifera roscoffensis]|uniref:putative mediator of RNA polymerase II transcription subunit 26 n=1 Tax=Symsagittifera roscoffensis TaxID=84072 RepID=UPI00307B48A6
MYPHLGYPWGDQQQYDGGQNQSQSWQQQSQQQQYPGHQQHQHHQQGFPRYQQQYQGYDQQQGYQQQQEYQQLPSFQQQQKQSQQKMSQGNMGASQSGNFHLSHSGINLQENDNASSQGGSAIADPASIEKLHDPDDNCDIEKYHGDCIPDLFGKKPKRTPLPNMKKPAKKGGAKSKDGKNANMSQDGQNGQMSQQGYPNGQSESQNQGGQNHSHTHGQGGQGQGTEGQGGQCSQPCDCPPAACCKPATPPRLAERFFASRDVNTLWHYITHYTPPPSTCRTGTICRDGHSKMHR